MFFHPHVLFSSSFFVLYFLSLFHVSLLFHVEYVFLASSMGNPSAIRGKQKLCSNAYCNNEPQPKALLLIGHEAMVICVTTPNDTTSPRYGHEGAEFVY